MNVCQKERKMLWNQDNSVYLGSEGLWETSMWYSNVSLQKLDHRQGERQLICSLLHFSSGQIVLHHELGQVTHDLRGGGHLRRTKEELLEPDDMILLKKKWYWLSLALTWVFFFFHHRQTIRSETYDIFAFLILGMLQLDYSSDKHQSTNRKSIRVILQFSILLSHIWF